MKKNISFSSWLKKALVLSFVAASLSTLIYFCFNYGLHYLEIDTDTYIKAHYNFQDLKRRRAAADTVSIANDIIIISTDNISGSDSRGEMADLINILCEADPIVVAIDLLFPERADPNNQRLFKAIKDHSDQIVLASTLYNRQVIDSFFPDDSLCYGLTNLPLYSKYSPFVVVDGDVFQPPLFSYQVAHVAFPNKEWDFDSFVVNYSPRSFQTLPGNLFLHANPASVRRFIEGKIVLVGDIDDNRDFHDIPFKINGTKWDSGIILHAYPILSLCNNDVAYKRMSPLWDYFLCLVLTLIFSGVFSGVALLGLHLSRQKRKLWYKLYLIIKPFFIFVIESGLVVLCIACISIPFGIIPSVIPYLISVLIINRRMSSYITYVLTQSNDE